MKDPQFLPLVTGAIHGALLKLEKDGPLMIDVEIEMDAEGNYSNKMLVTGRESHDEVLVTVEPFGEDD